MPNAFLREIDRIAASFNGIAISPLKLPPGRDFPAAVAPLAQLQGTVVLLSGGELDCARHHLLATLPWLQLQGRGETIAATLGETRFRFKADPFDILQEVVGRLQHPAAAPELPVTGGLFGYLGYDLKDRLETLPRTTMDPYGLPDFCLYAPSALLIQTRGKSGASDDGERSLPAGTRLLTPIYTALEATRGGAAESRLMQMLTSPPVAPRTYGTGGAFRSGFGPSTYRAAVGRIREYIAAGDVYQVNMSQCFEAPFQGDSYALFQDLYEANPAPFFAYVRAGDHQVVSTSPERFLKLRGRTVETRPIKGTRPRSSDPAEDLALRAELAASPKDDAELSMIVDLLRNDIGRVCKGGTVQVSEHKRVEAYTNVYHLVSIVTGELEAGRTGIDLLRATWPGGSITGCPKIRAMEIIDELEPTRRQVYTGSLGYIGFDGTMDLSIAIRTATISGGGIRFSVGGGVVFDSDPQAEYEETLHKGRTLMNALGGTETGGAQVWLDGLLVPADEARLPIEDLGIQYGYGLFETIRIRSGHPHNLEAHLERLTRSWKTLFKTEPPDLSWALIIEQLLVANALQGEEAAVKLMVTHGPANTCPQRPSIALTARPYHHRLGVIDRAGLRLGTYPETIATSLAEHKSLNYLLFYLAGRWAAAAGWDEALICDCDGRVSETNTANLLVVDGKRVVRPQSRGALPGTMEALVLKRLQQWGYGIETKPLSPADLAAAPGVLATNALMGPVPVMGVDGKPVPPCSDLCRRLRLTLGLEGE
jgi:para-aminobenzoate synthetase component 1